MNANRQPSARAYAELFLVTLVTAALLICGTSCCVFVQKTFSLYTPNRCMTTGATQERLLYLSVIATDQ